MGERRKNDLNAVANLKEWGPVRSERREDLLLVETDTGGGAEGVLGLAAFSRYLDGLVW